MGEALDGDESVAGGDFSSQVSRHFSLVGQIFECRSGVLARCTRKSVIFARPSAPLLRRSEIGVSFPFLVEGVCGRSTFAMRRLQQHRVWIPGPFVIRLSWNRRRGLGQTTGVAVQEYKQNPHQ